MPRESQYHLTSSSKTRPPPPTRPACYYFFFQNYAINKLKSVDPQARLEKKKMGPLIWSMWMKSNEETKAKFMKKAEMFWILYVCQKKKYQRKYGKIQKKPQRRRLINRNMEL